MLHIYSALEAPRITYKPPCAIIRTWLKRIIPHVRNDKGFNQLQSLDLLIDFNSTIPSHPICTHVTLFLTPRHTSAPTDIALRLSMTQHDLHGVLRLTNPQIQ